MSGQAVSPVAASPDTPEILPRGLVGRVLGVLTSPRATYADIAARPHWLGMAAVVLVLTIVPSTALMATEVGRRALLDQWVQAAEGFGRTVSSAQYQGLQRMASYAPLLSAVNSVFVMPMVAVVIAALILGIFGGLLGGEATFAQVFAVVVGSGVVVALRNVCSIPLDYARETLSSPTTLNAVLPFFEDNSFLAMLLSAIDLFIVWWIVSLAIGIAVVYERRTAPIAATLVAVYAAIGLSIALVRSLLSGA